MRFNCLLISVMLFAIAWVVHSETVVIIYTHNTNGVLENCNCPEHSYGALEKRAFIIDSVRKSQNHVLLIDTGDILDIRESRLLHTYIMQVYTFLNYDYWVPGDQDFIEGSSFFLNQMSKNAGQMLVTNLLYRGENPGKLSVVERLGEIKIGLTGTIRSDLIKYLENDLHKDFVLNEQMSSLDPVLGQLREECDFIVLLSHSGISRDREIASTFTDIDLILGAHSQTLLVEPEKIGDTYITQIGESGYRIGIMTLYFEDKKLLSMENRVILLTKDMPEDPKVNALIFEYHQKRLQK